MIKTILAIETPTEEDKKRVAKSLASLDGVLAADIVGDEAVVHHGSELDDEALVDVVYKCEGCKAQVICDEDED
jgi:hypothetical protein